MAFDFEQLINDPQFAFGLQLMGAKHEPNPYGAAMEAMRKMRLAQSQTDFQQAEMEQAKAHGLLYAQQVKQAQQKLENQSDFLKRFRAAQEGTPMDTTQAATTTPSVASTGLPSRTSSAFSDPWKQATLMTESGGNPNALSRTGAMGLMQIQPATAAAPGFGVTPLKDRSTQENLRFGSDYLDAMQSKYDGNKTLASIAYNMGPEATDKWLAAGGNFDKLPAETKNYIASIHTRMAVLNRGGEAAPPQAAPSPKQRGMSPQQLMNFGVEAGLAELPGSQALTEAAKFGRPVHMPEGGQIQGPGGELVPNPIGLAKQAELDLAKRGMAVTEKTAGQATTEHELKVVEQKQKANASFAADTLAFRNNTQNFDTTIETAKELLHHKGLPMIAGVKGALGGGHLIGAGKDAAVVEDYLMNKLFVDVIKEMKSLSPNGSTGVGQMAVQEGAKLQGAKYNYDRAQSLGQKQDALKNLITQIEESKNHFADAYKGAHGARTDQYLKPIDKVGIERGTGRKVILYKDGTHGYGD